MSSAAPTQPRIVVVGSLNMDLVVRVPTIPKPGETIQGDSFATFPGGKGANQAVAAARLGAQVRMVGRVGEDAFGEELIATIQQAGIDASQVQRDGSAATGVALITVEDSGQNNIALAAGANLRVTPAQVTAALEAMEPFDWLLMPLEIPLPAVAAAAQLAHRRGTRVLLNPAPAQPLPPELLSNVDLLAPNEFEAVALAGLHETTGPQIRQAASQLQSAAPHAQIVVTLGDRGVLLLEEGQFKVLPAFQVPVVDTTAAGDAFVAALAVRLGEGSSLDEAARFACAAGALAVSRAGAQPSLPHRSEVEQLLSR